MSFVLRMCNLCIHPEHSVESIGILQTLKQNTEVREDEPAGYRREISTQTPQPVKVSQA